MGCTKLNLDLQYWD